jgi:curved DNA-binding protein CbpA
MTADAKDLYSVLGLTPQATQEQIRRAYRTVLRQNHPDTRPPANAVDDAASTTALQQAIAAYIVLGDPARRAGYDRRTTPRLTRPSVSVRVVRRFTGADPQQPPIQVGPVHWQRYR